MALTAPNLDDLRFQRDLVDEARRRIVRYCPEWTEYNLSDPGITLIELFAWMTELTVYRLNQVPEKHYVEFLNLLGMQAQPASSARTDLTFWLSVALPISEENEGPVIVPAGTEVASRAVEEEGEVTFTTDERLTIVAPRLAELRRDADFHKNYLPRLGVEMFRAFGDEKPEEGATFYLGFDEGRDIKGHTLQLSFESDRTQAVGVRREDPPWVWECSMGDGAWQEVTPSQRQGEADTTGGLNNPRGSLVLYLPLTMQADQVYGRNALWVRCRLEQRRPEQGMYTESPRVTNVTAHALGASVPATHAIIVEDELLGTSEGEPAQSFTLEHAPILSLREDEVVEVQEMRQGELVFVPWQYVSDFSHSTRYDRHFTVEASSGEVSFGPAVRQPNGTVRQYGRVPEGGRLIRFTRYRYGGGVQGNVPADTLQTMTTSLAYIARVTNLKRASGGRDPESLEEVKARARRELRAQSRAVTAEDYQILAKNATRSVARVKCNTPRSADGRLSPGTVEVLIVPAVSDALAVGDLTKLHVDETLSKMVEQHLDQYRLLTTTLLIRQPAYIGVSVHADIIPSEFSRPEIVQARVQDALRAFISPLPLVQAADAYVDMGEGRWEGWPFGRNLYVAEVLSLIQRVPGVKHVLDVEVRTRPVMPLEEAPPSGEPRAEPSEEGGEEGAESAPGIATPIEGRVIRVASNTLLCSLDHEITFHRLGEEDDVDDA